MVPKDGSRRQYLTLIALEPRDGTLSAEVLVSYDPTQAVARRSLGHARECGLIVPAVLQKPAAIFEGLRSDEDEDPRGYGWRCYCGLPEKSYRADGAAAPPYRGQVYLVFIDDEGVAYNWRWERADHDNPTVPLNHATRFKQRLL